MATLIAAAIIIALIAIFSVQNAAPVAVTFLFWKFATSLAIAIFLSAVCGLVLGAIITYVITAKKHRRPAVKPEGDRP